MLRQKAWKRILKEVSLLMTVALVFTSVDYASVFAATAATEVEEDVDIALEDIADESTLEDDAETTDEASLEDDVETEDEESLEDEEAIDEASTEEDEELVEEIAEDEEVVETAEKLPWNVYVYMIGGESETKDGTASENIKEILKAKESDEVRVLLQAGGAKEWHLEDTDIEITDDTTRRFVINGSDIECVYDDKLTNMAESDSLSDFLSWGAENYPSDRSVVVLYGEGKGFRGLGTDEIYKDELSVTDIARAFRKSMLHIDVLAFDASSMADLDVMNKMSSYADMMIASENIIADEGLDYDTIINAIADNSGCRSTYLSKKICDSYFEESRDAGEDYITLSAVDLTKIRQVVDATTEYIDALTKLYNNDEKSLATLLAYLYYEKDYVNSRERDLRSLTEISLDVVSVLSPDLEADFNAARDDVADAVRNSVYYRVQGENSRSNTGIAFAYLFTSNSAYNEIYEKVSAFPGYVALMDALKYAYHPDSALYNEVSKNPEAKRDYFVPALGLEENKEGFASLVVENGGYGIASLDYVISEIDEMGRKYIISQRSDLETLKDNGKYITKFDGSVATIEGRPVVLMIDSEHFGYSYFNVPVAIENQDGEYEDCFLYVGYDETEQEEDTQTENPEEESVQESDRYTIFGIHKKNVRDDSAISYDIEPIPSGTKIRPAYPQSGSNDYKYGDEFIINSDAKISLSPLEDGEYSLIYFVTTGLGATEYSRSQAFYMKDEMISMTDPDAPEEEEENGPEEVSQKEALPIVSYKAFYGKAVPEELKDIHYEINTPVSENEATDESSDYVAESGASDDALDAPEKAKVTMLMYICGSDLENPGRGGGSDTLKLATNISESDEVNIVAQTGGTPEWGYEGLDGNSVQRFEAHEGKLVEVSNVPAYNISTGTAFSEFLNWGINNYPAEHYVLYVFDHGGAWIGTCWDYNFDSSHISMEDWAYALDSTGVVFDEIIFDECLMATVEVASVVAPYAKYMTGYEVSQMSAAYEWDRAFNYLIRHADDFDPESFGKMVVDMNADTWEEDMGGYIFQTMSLIDLSKIYDLNEALARYVDEVDEMLDDPKQFTALMEGVEKSRHYEYEFQKDIVDLMDHSVGVSLKTRQDVINAVDAAVVYKRTQFEQLRNNGLTMFFNISKYVSIYDTYADLCPIKGYVEFLDRATSGWHAVSDYYGDEAVRNVDVSDYKIDYEIINDGAVSEIKINDNEDALYKISYQILEYDEEQGTYYGLALRSDFAKGDDGEYLENFDGRVASIDGVRCYMTFDSFDGERIIYKIPAYAYGTSVFINVAFYPNDDSDLESLDANPQNGRYEVIGVSLGFSDLDVPEKSANIFNYGETITVLLPAFSKDGKELYQVSSGEVTYSDNMKISFKNLDDGEYVLRYSIENGLMMSETPDDVPIVIKDGRIAYVGTKETEDKE